MDSNPFFKSQGYAEESLTWSKDTADFGVKISSPHPAARESMLSSKKLIDSASIKQAVLPMESDIIRPRSQILDGQTQLNSPLKSKGSMLNSSMSTQLSSEGGGGDSSSSKEKRHLKSSSNKRKVHPNHDKQLIEFGVNQRELLKDEKLISSIPAITKSLDGSRLEGILVLSSFRLSLVPVQKTVLGTTRPAAAASWSILLREYFQIDLMMILSCERTVEKKGNSSSCIEIVCKDVRKFIFRFTSEQSEESFQFISLIVEMAFSKEIDRLPAFAFFQSSAIESKYQGWDLYDIQEEFKRMGLKIPPIRSSATANGLFRYLENDQKQYCETYPPLIAVPHNMTEEQIKKCAKFRSRERIPALTFAYFSSEKKDSPTTMWRCSQCKTGFISRSTEDETMLRLIGDPKDSSGTTPASVHIYDARPFINAVGNMVTGKGYETPKQYVNCEVYFLSIHNIHKVRDSFNRVMALCLAEDQSKWLQLLDQSLWLEHIESILAGTVKICDSMMKGFNVVIHCSDGWDRTSQLSALSQMLIDPYYRTIEGFGVLVEKDWVYFGHQFNLRQGHGVRNQSEESSPIFLQFLDCVHQILTQFPTQFEFNESMLVDIAKASYNCKFGTFLKNFYQELAYQDKYRSSTVSIWSWILHRKSQYLNPFYREEMNGRVLKPDFSGRSLKLWKRFFLYYSEFLREEGASNGFLEDKIPEYYNEMKEEVNSYQEFFKNLNIKLPQTREDFQRMGQLFQPIVNSMKNSNGNHKLNENRGSEETSFEQISKSKYL